MISPSAWPLLSMGPMSMSYANANQSFFASHRLRASSSISILVWSSQSGPLWEFVLRFSSFPLFLLYLPPGNIALSHFFFAFSLYLNLILSCTSLPLPRRHRTIPSVWWLLYIPTGSRLDLLISTTLLPCFHALYFLFLHDHVNDLNALLTLLLRLSLDCSDSTVDPSSGIWPATSYHELPSW
jgi:hypothetical protein